MFKNTTINDLIGKDPRNTVPRLRLPTQDLMNDWKHLVSQLTLIVSSMPTIEIEDHIQYDLPSSKGTTNSQHKEGSTRSSSQDLGNIDLDKCKEPTAVLAPNTFYEWEVDPKPVEALYPALISRNKDKTWAQELTDSGWSEAPQPKHSMQLSATNPSKNLQDALDEIESASDQTPPILLMPQQVETSNGPTHGPPIVEQKASADKVDSSDTTQDPLINLFLEVPIEWNSITQNGITETEHLLPMNVSSHENCEQLMVRNLHSDCEQNTQSILPDDTPDMRFGQSIIRDYFKKEETTF
uniref:Uncharacterized protein n=1 Tax=Sphaerodactylus townsendi TaxID=933632 RepID=A0ACB8ER54_9SAUR